MVLNIVDRLKVEYTKPLPKGVSLNVGNPFDYFAEAIVSPANSYGIMVGGFDAMLAKAFPITCKAIRSKLKNRPLVVGRAEAFPTSSRIFRYILVVPTMEEPGTRITNIRDVYEAAEGMLIEALVKDIGSITMTLLGTGVGGVSPLKSLEMILEAWGEIVPN